MVHPRGLLAGFVVVSMVLCVLPSQTAVVTEGSGSGGGGQMEEVHGLCSPPVVEVVCSLGASFTSCSPEDGEAVFQLAGRDASVRLHTGGVFLLLQVDGSTTSVEYRFVAANPVEPEGVCPVAGLHYRITGGPDGVRTTETQSYEEVWYRDIYPSIDLRYYLVDGRLKYDYMVHPGGDPALIIHRYKGAEGIGVEPDTGSLLVRTSGPVLVEKAPYAYQDTLEGRKEVRCEFLLVDEVSHGFTVGAHDDTSPLVIDPEMLWATYIGGEGVETGLDMEVDDEGHVYVLGYTYSPDFPLTPGTYDSEYTHHDPWIAKFSPDGKTLLQSTTVSGSVNEYPAGLDVDAEGCVYVAGHTWSTDFPYVNGSLDAIVPGNYSSFAFKLSADFTTLDYSARWGTSWWDDIYAQTLGPNNTLYVVGDAGRNDFNLSISPLDGWSYGSQYHYSMYAIALDPTGTEVTWGTYFGNEMERPKVIRVDGHGNVYICGSTNKNHWTSPGAYDRVQEKDPHPYYEGAEAYVVKIDTIADKLVYSTFLGGSGADLGTDLFVDGEGCALVVGETSSVDFPGVATGPDFAYSGGKDVFLAQLGPMGKTLRWSTFIGGSGSEHDPMLSFDGLGQPIVVAWTNSTDLRFTDGTTLASPNHTAFVTKLNITEASVRAMVPISLPFSPRVMVVNGLGEIHLTGSVYDDDGFNATEGAFQTEFGGGKWDAFVCKFGPVEDQEMGGVAPEADAGQDQTVDALQTMSFNGTGSRDDTGIEDYLWMFEHDGGTVRLVGPTPEFVFEHPGVYKVTLHVRDIEGNRDSDVVDIHVRDIIPPEARFYCPLEAQVGIPIQLDGKGSKDNMGIANYTWSVEEMDGTVELYGPIVERAFMAMGETEVTLRVTDVDGNWNETTKVILFMDLRTPDADGGPNHEVDPGDVVELNGTGSKDNHRVVGWNWTIVSPDGNETHLEGPVVAVSFEEPGEYFAHLVVRDPSGNEDKDLVLIVVRSPDQSVEPPEEEPDTGPVLSTGQIAILMAFIFAVLVIVMLIALSGAGEERY